MNNREKILMNLEYIGGGLMTLKILCDREKAYQGQYYDLFTDWIEVLYETVTMIEEDKEECQKPLKSLPQ